MERFVASLCYISVETGLKSRMPTATATYLQTISPSEQLNTPTGYLWARRVWHISIIVKDRHSHAV
eukprot:1325924-Pleurochrysis_carterae.AAC.6